MSKFFLRSRDLFPSRPFILRQIESLLRFLSVWISLRTKAPLRLIVARTIYVHQYRRFGGKPTGVPHLFTLVDTLECGHKHDCYGLELSDLINPYSENSQIRARRHRCRECAALLSVKKPVQSSSAGILDVAVAR